MAYLSIQGAPVLRGTVTLPLIGPWTADAVAAASAMTTWMGQVSAGINALAPGAVSPTVPPQFAAISGGSSVVKAG
jgi:hypothetical protein